VEARTAEEAGAAGTRGALREYVDSCYSGSLTQAAQSAAGEGVSNCLAPGAGERVQEGECPTRAAGGGKEVGRSVGRRDSTAGGIAERREVALGR